MARLQPPVYRSLQPINPRLLHQMQHCPSSGAEDTENVAFFAGFVAHVPL